MDILILRLEGMLQRWGERSQWDFRDTAAVPTKSGVIGLLSCGLGYARKDARILYLDKNLRYGVRVDRSGQLMQDYHTVTTDQKSLTAATGKPRVGGATIITPRQYLQDACFTVGLEGDIALMEECCFALQNPHWQLYLGAKSCVPSRPIFETIVSHYSTLEQALCEYPRPRRCDGTKTPYIEIEDANGSRVRHDKILQNYHREYGCRNAMVLLGGGKNATNLFGS